MPFQFLNKFPFFFKLNNNISCQREIHLSNAWIHNIGAQIREYMINVRNFVISGTIPKNKI